MQRVVYHSVGLSIKNDTIVVNVLSYKVMMDMDIQIKCNKTVQQVFYCLWQEQEAMATGSMML